MTFFNNLSTPDLITLISSLSQAVAAIIVGFISLYIFIKTLKLKSSKYLLLNIYLPIFNIIEPYLYKDINFNTLYPLMKSIDKVLNNVSFIPPLLKSQLENLHKDLSNEHYDFKNFSRFCYHIDTFYNQYCKESFLPLRSTLYKLKRKQYQTKFEYIFSFFVYIIKAVIFISIILLFCIIIFLWSLSILIVYY